MLYKAIYKFNTIPQDSNDIFHRTRTNILKNYMEAQKAPQSNSDPEKEEQSWRNLFYLTSNYTIRP